MHGLQEKIHADPDNGGACKGKSRLPQVQEKGNEAAHLFFHGQNEQEELSRPGLKGLLREA
jgi:hypothetical protein